MPTEADVELLVAMARQVFRPSFRPWVLFRQGTLVGLIPAGEEPGAFAIKVLRAAGPVRLGSSGRDFNVHHSTEGKWDGWIITFDHRLIATLVPPSEMAESTRHYVAVGLFGRGKRALDARELDVVHVESALD